MTNHRYVKIYNTYSIFICDISVNGMLQIISGDIYEPYLRWKCSICSSRKYQSTEVCWTFPSTSLALLLFRLDLPDLRLPLFSLACTSVWVFESQTYPLELKINKNKSKVVFLTGIKCTFKDLYTLDLNREFICLEFRIKVGRLIIESALTCTMLPGRYKKITRF